MSSRKSNLSIEEQAFSDMLKKRAINFGMCEMGKREWRERKSLGALLDMYVQNMEFILDNPNFVTNDFLLENAGKDILRNHGIYIDDTFAIIAPQDLVVRGECDGDALCTCYSTPEIYVCDDSKLNVHILAHSISYIRMYGQSKLNIKCDEGGKAFVYQFGGNVVYSGEGKVYVRDRRNGSK